MVKIEIEVDTLDQLAKALNFETDAVLLHNMSPDELRRAVRLDGGRSITEASGDIAAAVMAATGVDFLSMGWLMESVRALDIGLDYAS